MGQSAIVGKTALYTRIAHSTHGEELNTSALNPWMVQPTFSVHLLRYFPELPSFTDTCYLLSMCSNSMLVMKTIHYNQTKTNKPLLYLTWISLSHKISQMNPFM